MKHEMIVIIEDDAGVRFFLEEALKAESYSIRSFPSYEEAAPKIGADASLVIMDINLPGLDGLSAIEDIRKNWDLPVLIITAYGTKKNALEALKKGATDFFVKPIPLDELKVVVKRVLGKMNLRKELDSIREEEIREHVFQGVVGKSEVMKEIFRTLEKIADKDLTVLITGETGVGKERIAKLVHILSNRKGDFAVVNCASIPDNLLESELFGYEKGAFTGASHSKQGKIELAQNGTLVLDEIGEMSAYLQAKLLRVIETKEIERLGDIKKRKIDAKILATTNRDLAKEMKEGRFREDLYFRLSQMHFVIPPLRERREDIAVFIDTILSDFARESGGVVGIGEDARKRLLAYPWPGNVREMINVLKRAAIMCDGNIMVDDLPLHLKDDHFFNTEKYSEKSLDAAISEFEKELILNALRKTKGQQVKAAKLLDISERSMWYRIKKYAIEMPPN
jgi:DNA-binding NtrC family response regulator